jgi:hypothetical protein
MHMRKAIIRAVAPATLALILIVSGAAHARISKADADACAAAGNKCIETYCNHQTGTNKNKCELSCANASDKCLKNHGGAIPTNGGGVTAPSSQGVKDTGGTPNPKTGASTPSGGGVATDPKSPPKGGGTRAPVSGGVFNQPLTTGSGGSGPILRSSGRR